MYLGSRWKQRDAKRCSPSKGLFSGEPTTGNLTDSTTALSPQAFKESRLTTPVLQTCNMDTIPSATPHKNNTEPTLEIGPIHTHETFWEPFRTFDLGAIHCLCISDNPLPLGSLGSEDNNQAVRLYIDLYPNEHFGGFDYPPEEEVEREVSVLNHIFVARPPRKVPANTLC